MPDISQLLIRIDATTEQLRRELEQADQAVAKTSANIEQKLGSAEEVIESLGKGAGVNLDDALKTVEESLNRLGIQAENLKPLISGIFEGAGDFGVGGVDIEAFASAAAESGQTVRQVIDQIVSSIGEGQVSVEESALRIQEALSKIGVDVDLSSLTEELKGGLVQGLTEAKVALDELDRPVRGDRLAANLDKLAAEAEAANAALVQVGDTTEVSLEKANSAIRKAQISMQVWGDETTLTSGNFRDLTYITEGITKEFADMDAASASAAAGVDNAAGDIGDAFKDTSRDIGSQTSLWDTFLGGAAQRGSFHSRTLANSISRIALSAATGTTSVRSFGSSFIYLLGSINPAFALLGAGVSVIGTVIASFKDLEDISKDTGTDIDSLAKRIDELADRSSGLDPLVEKIGKIAEASGTGAKQAEIEVGFTAEDVEPKLEEQRKKIADNIRLIQDLLKQQPVVPAGIGGVGTLIEPQIQAFNQFRDALQSNDEDLSSLAVRIEGLARLTGQAFPEIASDAQQMGRSINQALQGIASSQDPAQIEEFRKQALQQIDSFVDELQQRFAQADVPALKLDIDVPNRDEINARLADVNQAWVKFIDRTDESGVQLLETLVSLKTATDIVDPAAGRRIDEFIRDLQKLQQESARARTIQRVLAYPDLFDSGAQTENRAEADRRLGQQRVQTSQQLTPTTDVRAEVAHVAALTEKEVERTKQLQQQGRTRNQIAAILREEETTNTRLSASEEARLSAAVRVKDEYEEQRKFLDQIGRSIDARAATAQDFRKQIYDISQQNVILQLPTEDLRAAGEAAVKLGVDLDSIVSSPEKMKAALAELPPELRTLLQQLVDVKRVASEITFNFGLREQTDQLKIINTLTDDTLNLTDAQAEANRILLQIKQRELETGQAITAEEELRIRQYQEQITIQNQRIRQQDQDRQREQISNQIGQQQQQLRAGADPLNIASRRVLGIDTEQHRADASMLQFQQDNPQASEEDISRMKELVTQQEALNTQLNLTNNILPGLADAGADFIMTMQFEGADEAGRQVLLMLERMALQLAFNVALALALNALLGGAPAAGGAGAGAGAGGVGLLVGGALKQHGGPVKAGHPYIVGESGRELVVPDSDAVVLPHAVTEKTLSGFASGNNPLFKEGQGPTVLPNSVTERVLLGRIPGFASGNNYLVPKQESRRSQGDSSFKVLNPEIHVIDQRQAGSPPISVSQQTGPDGRQIAKVVVRGAIDEMRRNGEWQKMMRQDYGVSPRPR